MAMYEGDANDDWVVKKYRSLKSDRMILYYSEINFQKKNNSWVIDVSKKINLVTQISFVHFCNYLHELLYEKVFLSSHINKNEFDENILDEIAYHSDLEITSSNIIEMDDIKLMSFECDGHNVEIKVFPANKIIIEASTPMD